jgi:hypothetical protein
MNIYVVPFPLSFSFLPTRDTKGDHKTAMENKGSCSKITNDKEGSQQLYMSANVSHAELIHRLAPLADVWFFSILHQAQCIMMLHYSLS